MRSAYQVHSAYQAQVPALQELRQRGAQFGLDIQPYVHEQTAAHKAKIVAAAGRFVNEKTIVADGPNLSGMCSKLVSAVVSAIAYLNHSGGMNIVLHKTSGMLYFSNLDNKAGFPARVSMYRNLTRPQNKGGRGLEKVSSLISTGNGQGYARRKAMDIAGGWNRLISACNSFSKNYVDGDPEAYTTYNTNFLSQDQKSKRAIKNAVSSIRNNILNNGMNANVDLQGALMFMEDKGRVGMGRLAQGVGKLVNNWEQSLVTRRYNLGVGGAVGGVGGGGGGGFGNILDESSNNPIGSDSSLSNIYEEPDYALIRQVEAQQAALRGRQREVQPDRFPSVSKKISKPMAPRNPSRKRASGRNF